MCRFVVRNDCLEYVDILILARGYQPKTLHG